MAPRSDGGFISRYFEHTRRPIYSIAASAPFFIAYQLGILWLLPAQPEGERFRNHAEVILHLPAGRVGRAVAILLPVLAGMVLLYVLHRRESAERAAREGKSPKRKARWGGFRFDFWLGTYAEGLILAVPLGLLAQELPRTLSFAGSKGGRLLFQLTTMCGAGAYEELLFRLFLFTAFFYLGHKLFNLEKLPAGILAAAVTGVLFAFFHPRGNFLHPSFEPGFFIFATIAGVYLAAICHFRSFGLAVTAHAIYDIFTVLRP